MSAFDPEKVKEQVMKFAALGVFDVQLMLSKVVRLGLSRPGTGNLYRIGIGRKNGRNLRARGWHRASAPGFPPAVNTGRLRQSWAIAGAGINASAMFGRKGRQTSQDLASISMDQEPGRLTFRFGSNLKYAKMLEYGTRHMKARPYIRPSIRLVAPNAPKIIAAAIKRGFAGGYR